MTKLSRKEFKKSIPQILEIFNNSPNSLTPNEKKIRVQKARKNFWFFFKYYLSHYSTEKTPLFHKEIFKLLEKDTSPLVIGAPRGFSKSTLVSFAYVIWNIIKTKYKFIVIISATDDLAEDLCEFIKLEFSDNKKIINDFGELLSTQGCKGDFFVHKTRVFARGKKQAIRGFRSREYRPDLIILDDIEKDEEALSPKIVTKTLELITHGLIPSLTPNGKLIIIGTILQRRSVFGTLLLSDETPWIYWHRKIYSALQYTPSGKEKSLWEERFPINYLKKQKKIIGASAFNTEYQNIPSDEENRLFKEKYMKTGTVDSSCTKVLFIDPSVDGIKNNDFKACVLVGKDNHGIYEIIDGVIIQNTDTVFFSQIIDIYKKHQDTIIGTYIESNSFQFYYMKELDQFARNHNVELRISGVKHYQKKEMRINRILPLFETEKIYFNPDFKKTSSGKTLIEQLIFFPNSNIHDDGPDALAGAIDVLSKYQNNKTSSTYYPTLPKKNSIYTKRSFLYD